MPDRADPLSGFPGQLTTVVEGRGATGDLISHLELPAISSEPAVNLSPFEPAFFFYPPPPCSVEQLLPPILGRYQSRIL